MIIKDIIQKLFASPTKCSKKGCNAPAIPCYLPTPYDNQPVYYCRSHAVKEGFCFRCGKFAAGEESFDNGDSDFCHNCEVKIEKYLKGIHQEEMDEFI